MSDNVIGERIKFMRENKGLSQESLAIVLNVARQTIGYYESGKRIPDSEFILKLCKYFQCSADYLLGLSNFRNVEEETGHFDSLKVLNDSLSQMNNSHRIMMIKCFLSITESYINCLKSGSISYELKTIVDILNSTSKLIELVSGGANTDLENNQLTLGDVIDMPEHERMEFRKDTIRGELEKNLKSLYEQRNIIFKQINFFFDKSIQLLYINFLNEYASNSFSDDFFDYLFDIKED